MFSSRSSRPRGRGIPASRSQLEGFGNPVRLAVVVEEELRIEIAVRAPTSFGVLALVWPVGRDDPLKIVHMGPGQRFHRNAAVERLGQCAHPHHLVVARHVGPANVEQHQRIGLGHIALKPFALPGEDAIGIAAFLLDLHLAVAEVLVIGAGQRMGLAPHYIHDHSPIAVIRP
jgi:hypothetical protein